MIDAIHFREFPVHDQSDALRQGFGESQFQSTMSSSLGVEIHVRVNIQDVQSVSLGILVSRDPHVATDALQGLIRAQIISIRVLGLQRFGGQRLAVHVEGHQVTVEMLEIQG